MFPKLSKWEKYLKNINQGRIKNALERTKELHNLVHSCICYLYRVVSEVSLIFS